MIYQSLIDLYSHNCSLYNLKILSLNTHSSKFRITLELELELKLFNHIFCELFDDDGVFGVNIEPVPVPIFDGESKYDSAV